MNTPTRISIALHAVERGPLGPVLATATGRIDQTLSFAVTVTAQEMHFAFVGPDGPSFSVNMNDLAKEATNAIEALLGRRRDLR